jgi:hypothetical protein
MPAISIDTAKDTHSMQAKGILAYAYNISTYKEVKQ